MKAPEIKPIVRLVGDEDNAFLIMGRVKKALVKAGADQEYINQYIQESKSGDYDNLLRVAMKYTEVE